MSCNIEFQIILNEITIGCSLFPIHLSPLMETHLCKRKRVVLKLWKVPPRNNVAQCHWVWCLSGGRSLDGGGNITLTVDGITTWWCVGMSSQQEKNKASDLGRHQGCWFSCNVDWLSLTWKELWRSGFWMSFCIHWLNHVALGASALSYLKWEGGSISLSGRPPGLGLYGFVNADSSLAV